MSVLNPAKEYEKLKAAAAHARLPFEKDAWLNLAFYLGYQYTRWNVQSRTVEEIRKDERNPQPRPVINKIMHFVGQEHAMAMQDRPWPDVLPATGDIPDIIDAEVARGYVDHVADPTQANFDKKLARAVLWAIICQEGYLKWTWNAKDKRPEITPVGFFELYCDPYAREWEKQRYVIHSQFMDVEQVYENWGIEISAGKVEKADITRTELLRGMGSSPVLSGVTVNELWYKPCRRHPKGLLVIWSGKQIIYRDDFPYDHGELPFTQVGAIERPDSMHFMSPVTYLRPAQMELNAYHAQRFMGRRNFNNMKWWIPAELELVADPDDSPNQVLRGKNPTAPGVEPKLIQGAAPTDTGDGQLLEEQMMHIVGLHEVSQAQVPGRVEAAKAIEMLKESDASRQEMMRKTVNASIVCGFYQVLRLAQQFDSEGTMVAIHSREGVPEVKKFRAKKLKPGFRLRIAQTTGLARSRAARQEQLGQLWDRGILRDPEVMADLMDVPLTKFTPQKAIDVKRARSENLLMADGQAIKPYSWDDHAIHIREHDAYRKTAEFDALPTEAKQRFEFHVDKHKDGLKVAAIQQAELMAIMQGAAAAGQSGEQPSPGGSSGLAAPDSATEQPTPGTV